MKFGREIALRDLTIQIPRGAIYALLGPNGAGKTTFIKLLLNILRPTSGGATVLGLPSTRIAGEAFTDIGYVSENQEMPEWMTIRQLLDYLRPFYPRWDVAVEQQFLRQFDVPTGRKLKHLSRGQRMKAALLSVLPYNPALIILDEPFSGLDPLVRDELTEGLLDRAALDDPPTILVSSHDLAEIETLATHIGYLERGRLIFSEESAALTERFREVTVTLGAGALNLSASETATHVAGDAAGAASAFSPRQVPSAALRGPKLGVAEAYPASWLMPERSASVFRFIHAHANAEPVAEQVGLRFPESVAVELQPMSLRAIFLALAKSGRSDAQLAARTKTE